MFYERDWGKGILKISQANIRRTVGGRVRDRVWEERSLSIGTGLAEFDKKHQGTGRFVNW